MRKYIIGASIIIVTCVMMTVLGFGFIVGLYSAKEASVPGGMEMRGMPLWIKIGTYPATQSAWLYRFHLWQAMRISPNGESGYNAVILFAHYPERAKWK